MARMAVTVTAALLAVILSAVSSPMRVVADNSAPPPYVNHTVGGAAGWIFNVRSNISAVNFSDWATSQSFFLGDYLIFKTGTALPVIQTYNVTTYARCNADDDNGNETYVYDGSASDASPAVIPVPLTVEGDNYYFSGAGDDRFQCSHGMRFHIVVQHGRGLPPSLSQPPPPPYTEPASPPVTPAPPGGGTTPQEESFYNGSRRRGVEVWVEFLGFFFGALLVMI